MTQYTLFQREVKIRASLDHVWQLVASEEGLRQWWGNPIALEANEGGRCEEWRTDRQGTTHWQGVVTLYAPPHQLIMALRPQPMREDAPELTTITISLEAQGDETALFVSQRAFGPEAATGKPVDAVPQPGKPLGVPLAQLEQPAPGALPMPARALQPGQVEPAHLLLAHAQAGALRAAWEARLSALLAAIDHQP